jgi:hypothetical protein
MSMIYESPDGGKTVYGRLPGESDRKLIHQDPALIETLDSIREDKLWGEIRRTAKKNAQLNVMLEEVKVYYNLIRTR